MSLNAKLNILKPLSTCLSSLKTPEITVFGLTNVRYRKRRDNPKAPSKMYNVREPTPVIKEEHDILYEKQRHYNTQVKSILSFLRCQKKPINFMYKEKELLNVDHEAELKEALLINEQWNQQIAMEREVRLAEEISVRDKLQQVKVLAHLKKLETEQEIAKTAVRNKMVRRANAVNFDTLDEDLEKFLDGPITEHNFALKAYTGEKITDLNYTPEEYQGVEEKEGY